MKKLVCDLCKKEFDVRGYDDKAGHYDETGYSECMKLVIRNSQKYDSEYDICNHCYENVLECLREKYPIPKVIYR